jgi:hypothetical protein
MLSNEQRNAAVNALRYRMFILRSEASTPGYYKRVVKRLNAEADLLEECIEIIQGQKFPGLGEEA